ncbi:MAG TPA: hypothetical protein VJ246_01385 [Patescibacteria group bacterium]|nr:hypothetical protein [Patescibacteria group bacterium]
MNKTPNNLKYVRLFVVATTTLLGLLMLFSPEVWREFAPQYRVQILTTDIVFLAIAAVVAARYVAEETCENQQLAKVAERWVLCLSAMALILILATVNFYANSALGFFGILVGIIAIFVIGRPQWPERAN